MEKTARAKISLAKEASSPNVFLRLPRSSNEILHNPIYNKGTGFTREERDSLSIRGLLPPGVQSIETQTERALDHTRSFATPIQKYLYLASLKQRNETLFYRLLVENIEEMMPLVYTPTVGLACQLFDRNFRMAEGMYFCKEDAGKMRSMLDNWYYPEVDIIVVTDGSRILGLGDLGANGMGIPIGKLSLYVAASGFHPARTLPICIDTGTNNQEYLDDPYYLGMRHKRLPDSEYYPLIDEFMKAVTDKWPEVLIQFEDFSNEHCFDLLAKYRKNYLCFNDDIQGTGAVVAAGFLNAVKMAGKSAREQRLIFLGAGSAGIGVADAIVMAMIETCPGLTLEEARKKFWFLDSRGLVTANRGGKLEAHKVPYARTDNGDTQIPNLLGAIEYVKPTALIGLAGLPAGVFDENVIRKMGEINAQPIIFALSNPTTKAECTAEAAYKFTDGRAIFASGSPFDAVTIGNKVCTPSQGNNMYIFPGLGFGTVIARSKEVTDGMLSVAAKTLAEGVTKEEFESGRLYPKLNRIREISAAVAAAVVQKAFEEGVAQAEKPADILAVVREAMYFPDYRPLTSKV